MKIIFVRHGHPDYVKNCLTDLGHKHAAAAAERLKGSGIQEIYSSPYGRAVETAEYTAKLLGLDIEKLDFMREIVWGSPDKAPYEDGHPWNTVDEMIRSGEDLMCPDWREKDPFRDNRLEEHTAWLSEELDKWLCTLGYTREGDYYRVGDHTDKIVALFSHGGSSSAALAHLFNLPLPFVFSAFRPDYTAITVVNFSDETGQLTAPQFELVNDARHIDDLKTEGVFGH